jgi:hypothetical protein
MGDPVRFRLNKKNKKSKKKILERLHQYKQNRGGYYQCGYYKYRVNQYCHIFLLEGSIISRTCSSGNPRGAKAPLIPRL